MPRRSQKDPFAGVELFKKCSKAEKSQLAWLTTDRHVEAGEVICEQGAAGREAFIVLDGEATVEIDGVVVATVGAHGFFGEMALLDGGPRVATVMATTPMDLLVLNRMEFPNMLRIAPVIAVQMLEEVARRLRQARSGELPIGA